MFGNGPVPACFGGRQSLSTDVALAKSVAAAPDRGFSAESSTRTNGSGDGASVQNGSPCPRPIYRSSCYICNTENGNSVIAGTARVATSAILAVKMADIRAGFSRSSIRSRIRDSWNNA